MNTTSEVGLSDLNQILSNEQGLATEVFRREFISIEKIAQLIDPDGTIKRFWGDQWVSSQNNPEGFLQDESLRPTVEIVMLNGKNGEFPVLIMEGKTFPDSMFIDIGFSPKQISKMKERGVGVTIVYTALADALTNREDATSVEEQREIDLQKLSLRGFLTGNIDDLRASRVRTSLTLQPLPKAGDGGESESVVDRVAREAEDVILMFGHGTGGLRTGNKLIAPQVADNFVSLEAVLHVIKPNMEKDKNTVLLDWHCSGNPGGFITIPEELIREKYKFSLISARENLSDSYDNSGVIAVHNLPGKGVAVETKITSAMASEQLDHGYRKLLLSIKENN